jgi:hypothetical protein
MPAKHHVVEFYFPLQGKDWICWARVYPGTRPTREDPGCGAEVELFAFRLDGIDGLTKKPMSADQWFALVGADEQDIEKLEDRAVEVYYEQDREEHE